ncbi:hypothetical protein [Sphingomonas sp. 66-10]|uniref:hypothetical protein n=1 Tax=Sphingomonas sp. 66-10 TaxID=1895848 RepID=UPI000B0B2EBE|nr:hypothetical protein [Sphingomonas sp. 66-10]
MIDRHLRAHDDLTIRLTGLLAVGVCLLALLLLARHLAGRPMGRETGWDLILAAIGFVTGSIGSMGVAYGRHLFDEIEVAPRWRRLPKGALAGPDEPPAVRHGYDESTLADDMVARRFSSSTLRLLKLGGLQ